MEIQEFSKTVAQIEQEIAKEMIGLKGIIHNVLIAVISGGNVLLEGVPGLGKTRLVKTLSKVLDLDFKRIQFTPDLMPSDVVGTNILVRDEQGNSAFRFQAGPVFSNLVLADEINRATPKTQSALLEAMQEHTVTVGGVTRELPQPYFVLATQNPLEQEGTYPLPEAQLDRFLFKLLLDMPSLDELHRIVDLTTGVQPMIASSTSNSLNNTEPLEASESSVNFSKQEGAQKIADATTILQLKQLAAQVPVAKPVQDYALRLVMNTHPQLDTSPEVTKRLARYGSSPRGAQAIIQGAKVQALMDGRYNVSFEDIRNIAYPALRHRISLNYQAVSEGKNSDAVIQDIINATDE
ncbi:MAG: AAA domain-containing protein [Clostridiales bacterium]|nr:AAA domain-containing protein [Clostridiales bacterium]